uniref:zinc finger protein 271 isoform X2 n=1 Tax=Solea senegalensis TaxID=28829 RepID=UPI001CD8F3F6|nr:zinc finger protein 271 isoform X2 [Solea senegalensis]
MCTRRRQVAMEGSCASAHTEEEEDEDEHKQQTDAQCRGGIVHTCDQLIALREPALLITTRPERPKELTEQVSGLQSWSQRESQSEGAVSMTSSDLSALMSSLLQCYHDISPVTLQLVGGAVSSSLYCEEVEGLAEGAGPLVESFLVELFRCKLCQFTCGLKSAIDSHLVLTHRAPALTYVGGANDVEGPDNGAEMRVQQGTSPYQLDLKGESKPSDDEDFLLYNMLDNMSPPTCDISTEAGLQVAHTCEVSTLFEGEESIFCLKGTSMDLSCRIDSASTQEEMAQSAHLMTLGLCRISSTRPPPPPPPPPNLSSSSPAQPPEDSTHLPQTQRRASSGRRRLPCRLCPATLASRHLLDIHTRSHRATGGFGCICCSWTAHSWAELEPHWRSHCMRRGRSRKRRRSEGPTRGSSLVTADRGRGLLNGRAEGKKVDQTFSQSDATVLAGSGPQHTLLQSHGHKTRRGKKINKEEEKVERLGFCCTLCQRKFSSQLTLRRHMGVHSSEKPFICPHCSYSSRLKASLRQHLRTHTGEKPYKCTVCSYASIDLSSLLRHQRTHSKEKPYRCELCDYSSIQKKSLDLHARRHHTGEAFPCRRCDYSSPDRQLLLRHIQRHHASSQP